MFFEIFRIAEFIWKNIINIWPYLLITIPISVIIKVTEASKYIKKIFNKSIYLSIFLATVIGAFSPFCSCSVIPIIASLLIGGVPLAPVMSFWLASPSMDPEIFFLSVSVLGWNLALWRLISTFFMSLFSGLITHYLVKRNIISDESTIKAYNYNSSSSFWNSFLSYLKEKVAKIGRYSSIIQMNIKGMSRDSCNSNVDTSLQLQSNQKCCNSNSFKNKTETSDSCCNNQLLLDESDLHKINVIQNNNTIDMCSCESKANEKNESRKSLRRKIYKETISATLLVIKFMVLAYFLEAVIILYIPTNYITIMFGGNNILTIILSAFVGIPVYTSTLPALALVGGFITKGFLPAAALSFLISGPTTTIPAMAAVWNLANKKVFFLYVGYTLFFAILSGLLYYFVPFIFN